MRIFLATCGSRGDVQPMFALCLALQSSGHDVMLAGPPEKEAWAKKLGCPYTRLGKDVTAFIDNLEDAVSFKTGIQFISFVYREILTQFEILPKLVKNADLIIGSSLVFALSSVAESKSIPYRYIAFTPQLLPSRAHPFPGVQFQRLPEWLNKLSWDLAKTGDKFCLTRIVNKGRKKLGLNPIKDAWEHILGKNTIIAADRQVAKVPFDSKINNIQTGYMHLELPEKNLPELDNFIAAGSPPIFAGFGSMPKIDQARNIPLLVEAARIVKKRIVIAKFWEGFSKFSKDDDVFLYSKVSTFKALFKNVRCNSPRRCRYNGNLCRMWSPPDYCSPHT